MTTCVRCKAVDSAGLCCSSHKAALCHACYRCTHFVEVCIDGCADCAREGLAPRPATAVPEATPARHAGPNPHHPENHVTVDSDHQLSGHIMRDYDEAILTLRKAWLRKGPTQQALAHTTGLSRPQVATWLAGDAGAGPRRLFALAHALGYDLALIPRDNT